MLELIRFNDFQERLTTLRYQWSFTRIRKIILLIKRVLRKFLDQAKALKIPITTSRIENQISLSMSIDIIQSGITLKIF